MRRREGVAPGRDERNGADMRTSKIVTGVRPVGVDLAGHRRCWRCGDRHLAPTLSRRSRAASRLGRAWPTTARCGRCGRLSDLDHPTPFDGPSSHHARFQREWAAELDALD